MSFPMHAVSVETFVPMLGTLTHLFEKVTEHAHAKKIDVAPPLHRRVVDAKVAGGEVEWSTRPVARWDSGCEVPGTASS